MPWSPESRELLLATLDIKIADSVTIAVPGSLESITTYVLLEQERWFEKEMDFLRHWLRLGMTAIDIGANLGVYSLPMARLVGPTGRVFAYEPGTAARALLERSRERNGADNLHVSACALSDSEREGRLAFGVSSEGNALGNAGPGETVRITTLDMEEAAQGWTSPDFIKIDAEGEEERILAGGREFFARHSPLVMFEKNEQLRTLFPALGYRLFRQLGGAPILVPLEEHEPLDRFELNLFAAKPDRASALSRQGVLVDQIPVWAPSEADCANADVFWQSRKFAQPTLSSRLVPTWPADAEYRNSLAAYAVWRAAERPLATRCAALAFALRNLTAICARTPTAAHLSTLARVAWEWGARGECGATLQRLFVALQSGNVALDEPFWPACPRFDNIAPGTQPQNWFAAAVAEQFELTSSFSSVFTGEPPFLEWLCGQPFASIEMERRRVLRAARAGRRPAVPARLCRSAPDHLNAEIWRGGRIPGTIVGATQSGLPLDG
jgi:FkbM family methyltransferase